MDYKTKAEEICAIHKVKLIDYMEDFSDRSVTIKIDSLIVSSSLLFELRALVGGIQFFFIAEDDDTICLKFNNTYLRYVRRAE